jgi:hypothetical protein
MYKLIKPIRSEILKKLYINQKAEISNISESNGRSYRKYNSLIPSIPSTPDTLLDSQIIAMDSFSSKNKIPFQLTVDNANPKKSSRDRTQKESTERIPESNTSQKSKRSPYLGIADKSPRVQVSQLEKENNQVFSIEMLEKVTSNVLKRKQSFRSKMIRPNITIEELKALD